MSEAVGATLRAKENDAVGTRAKSGNTRKSIAPALIAEVLRKKTTANHPISVDEIGYFYQSHRGAWYDAAKVSKG